MTAEARHVVLDPRGRLRTERATPRDRFPAENTSSGVVRTSSTAAAAQRVSGQGSARVAGMGMAEKIVQRAQSHLAPGEVVQGAFAGQPTLTNRIGQGGYRIVVATDRRFLVFQSGTFSQTVLKDLIEQAPRHQRLGEPSGVFYDVTVGSQSMKVNFRYFTQVRAIDLALDAPPS